MKVPVHSLKRGDHFVLSHGVMKNVYIYVVTDVSANGVDCVTIQNGKEFTFGKDVEVFPVKVSFIIEGVSHAS